MLVLEARACCRQAYSIRHRHCLRWEGMALRLLLDLEIIPLLRLARRRDQLRLAEELHVGGAGIAGRGRGALVQRSKLQLIHHERGAVLLLLAVVDQVLLILKVNSGQVHSLDHLGLVVRAEALVLRAEDVRVVELVDAVAQILIQLVLGGLVPAIAAVLGHHEVLLVLLLEELFVDLGDVLRDYLGVRVRVRSACWD